MLPQKVRAVLKKECNFPDDSRFLIGVSGGPDSVCLLDILTQLPYEIIIGHLNHNLRLSSREEMEFVEKLSAKYGCKFIGKTENILELSQFNKSGIEETAREARYKFLFNSAKEENAKAVLVAHHADDQIETLLMNFIRGTGLEGMAGMQVKSIGEFDKEIPLVRPFINSWHKEIMNYCNDHSLEFRIDESNLSLSNTRSSIRNRLIPELAKYNPSIKKTLLRTRQVIEEDLNFLKESTCSAENNIHLTNENDEVTLDLNSFRMLPLSLQRLVIKDILEKYFFQQDINTFSNIEAARKLLTREIKSTSLKITNQLFVSTSGNKGILSKRSKNNFDCLSPKIEQELKITLKQGVIPLNEIWHLEIEETSKDQIGEDFIHNQDHFKAYFDKDKLNESLTIRVWINGDRFQHFGMDGKSIKLSDYWINHKVPLQARINWPLVVNMNQIIWIPGFQQAHYTRIIDKTQKIIIMQLKSSL